jgi:tRNA(Met) cytidine acetyltransferase
MRCWLGCNAGWLIVDEAAAIPAAAGSWSPVSRGRLTTTVQGYEGPVAALLKFCASLRTAAV